MGRGEGRKGKEDRGGGIYDCGAIYPAKSFRFDKEVRESRDERYTVAENEVFPLYLS